MATIPIAASTEIVYPIETELSNNWHVQRTDDNVWNGGKTAATTLTRRTATVGFRVQRENFGAFIDALNDNIADTLTFNHSGVDIFLTGTTSDSVLVLNYNWEREGTNFYKINVRMLKV